MKMEKNLMVSENPFAEFHLECKNGLVDALQKSFPEIEIARLPLSRPPSLEFGELASSICFQLSRRVGEPSLALAKQLVETLDKSKLSLIEDVAPAGEGYINFHVDYAGFSALTIESVRHFDTEYGFVKTDKPLEIIVEHTSANPLHPIHIGQARNPMLGDAVARLLKSRGHKVYRHYYVDDVGRQSAVLAYGYEKLGRPEPEGKPDSFFGRIYTATSCLVEINRLKKELEDAKAVSATEEIDKLNRELDDWVSVAAELEQKYPELFEVLLAEIGEDEDPEILINDLIKKYERGDKHGKQLIREVSELCLQGFKETLSRVEVFYDSWDWESELMWSSRVRETIDKLKRTRYVFPLGGVLEFDGDKVAEELGLKKKLGLRNHYEIPSLTLVRSDGTTLYPTRDIAYTLWKFEKAEKVINVIGMEQKLAQLQLKIALHALGHANYADNLVHFAYNLVSLPGYKMSSRTGRYITFDETVDEAEKRAYEEVSKRSPQLPEKQKQEIAEFVGIGAVRYALVEVDPSKPVVFTWDRVLNFETNSAPYIQYSHARGCSILRKAAKKPEKPAYNLLNERIEHELIMAMAGFPDLFIDSAELLKPNLIADFANSLADRFNTFYNALPVIKAKPRKLSDARLALVDAVRIVLRNALKLIGIVAPERM
jgi:arginyl-tRNA synthetase